MAAAVSSIDRLVTLLGGWPEHFQDDERRYGESLLELLNRDRIVDEASFDLVVFYATHRAAYDKLSSEILAEGFEASANNYLSGKEQSRAFHENKALLIQDRLLTTPYARAKSGLSTQTSFMDKLDELPTDDGDGKKVVTPFRPMAKKKRG